MALGLREPAARSRPAAAAEAGRANGALSHLLAAGRWIAHTPLALFVIVAGLALDSVVRLFMTFSSSYFRLIDLPAASYGLIGAALGGLGLVVSPLARRMVTRGTPAGNFALLAGVIAGGAGRHGAAVAAAGAWSSPCRWGWRCRRWRYLVSYYLNATVDSRQRATVLSFKGLAFNLGYGLVSLVFAGALRALRRRQPGGDLREYPAVAAGVAGPDPGRARDGVLAQAGGAGANPCGWALTVPSCPERERVDAIRFAPRRGPCFDAGR